MNAEQADLLNRITIKEGMMSGQPTIRGIRFPVKDILELLSSGMTWEEILKDHQVLEKDDIKAALLYASSRLSSTITLNAA